MRARLLLAVLALLLLFGAGMGVLYVRRRLFQPPPTAAALVARGDLRAAFIALRGDARDRPEDPGPHLAMADLQLKLEDPAAAEAELKRAAVLGADRWAVLPRLGPVLLAQNRGRELLDQLPADAPTPRARHDLRLLRAAAQLAGGNRAGAAASLAEARAALPGTAAAAVTQARLDLAAEDLPAAERGVDEALRIDPNEPDALLMKVRFATVRGDGAAALSLAERAVAAMPWSNVARLDRASLLLDAGDDPRARQDVDAVLLNQPRDAAALLMQAVLTVREGRFNDASVLLQRIAPSARAIPRILFYQALVAGILRQTESALDLAARYLSLVPDDPDGVRLLARLELAVRRPVQALATLGRLSEADRADPRSGELLGAAYTTLGRLPEAAAAYGRLSIAAPDDPLALIRLGMLEARLGGAGLPGTLDRLSVLAARQPAAAEALVGVALSAGNVELAGRTLDRLEAERGGTEAVALLKGAVLLARNDAEGAENAMAEAVRRFPGSVRAKLGLADAMRLRGRAQDGEAVLRPVLAADPANLRVLTSFLQSVVARRAYAPALAALRAARAADPQNAGLAAMEADIMVRDGQARPAAVALAASMPPDEMPPAVLGALSRAQVAAGMAAEARATLAQAVLRSPEDPEPRRLQAEFLVRAGDHAAARTVLAAAVERFPGQWRLLTMLVAADETLDGLDAALERAAALRTGPVNMPAAALLRGDLLMRARRPADAVAAFRGEWAAAPTVPLVLRLADALAATGQDEAAATLLSGWLDRPGTPDPAVQATLARLDIRAGNLPRARTLLEAVLAARPTDGDTLNNLAWVYAEANDPRALPTARRAYIEQPGPESADTLGWALVRNDQARAALPLLRDAAAARPANGTVALHYGAALKAAGQGAEAAAILSRLAASGPGTPEGREAARLLGDGPAARHP